MSGKRFTLADLPPKYLAEVERQLAGGKPLGMARAAAVGAVEIYETPNRSPLSHPEPQPHEAPALERTAPGEKESLPRTVVRFIGYRVKPLDPDNFAGSVKDLLDGLRHAQLIPGDEPWRITLETEQVKVRSFKEEKTVIEILA